MNPENQEDKEEKKQESVPVVSADIVSAIKNLAFKTMPDFVSSNMLVEFFSRLPIALMLKCKLVCKDWYIILSKSSFTDGYSRISNFTRFVIPQTTRYNPRSKLLYLIEISENGNIFQTPIKPRLPDDGLNKSPSFRFIGCCKGFLCFYVSDRKTDVVYIYNPLKEEYTVLPQYDCIGDYKLGTYKFGFATKFKVVRFSERSTRHYTVNGCEIFTVGVDHGWRRLTVSLKDFLYLPMCVYLNGKFHGLAKLQDEGPFHIGTFDLEEEKVGQISHPAGVVLRESMKLRIVNNQLVLVYEQSLPSQFTIWRMEEYGNVDSWTKTVIQRCWFPSDISRSWIYVVGGLKTGDTLFGRDNELVSFNAKTNKCTVHQILFQERLHDLEEYVPSFSALNECGGS